MGNMPPEAKGPDERTHPMILGHAASISILALLLTFAATGRTPSFYFWPQSHIILVKPLRLVAVETIRSLSSRTDQGFLDLRRNLENLARKVANGIPHVRCNECLLTLDCQSILVASANPSRPVRHVRTTENRASGRSWKYTDKKVYLLT